MRITWRQRISSRFKMQDKDARHVLGRSILLPFTDHRSFRFFSSTDPGKVHAQKKNERKPTAQITYIAKYNKTVTSSYLPAYIYIHIQFNIHVNATVLIDLFFLGAHKTQYEHSISPITSHKHLLLAKRVKQLPNPYPLLLFTHSVNNRTGPWTCIG